ncbi:MAG TPA: ATP-binding cassette domain-containing protein [Baekduia sp.]|uniref:ABC transporter ATP-binding protein n=1 Tax=Baekduia sp. TaxID=2600305 RepID=UPI002D7902CF|nr:ATP-binding cassette domain-containing protein [Baekduia sp.]HET6509982.1 ATP-binding cassette domain-containing protein [Baekduia sp.]
MSAAIATEGLSAGYDRRAVVTGLDLRVESGEVVALLGANGAGKTTTMLTLAGELPPLAGSVAIDGAAGRAPLYRRARRGLALVTEERSVFMRMSTADNLRVGRCDRARALALFPELEPLLDRTAGLLSGGEQQILTLARALARWPRVLLADELSLGLAPMVVDRLLQAVRDAADQDGVGVLLVEQHVEKALRVADRAYVMSRGRVVLSGRADEVRQRLHEVEDAYLAGGAPS